MNQNQSERPARLGTSFLLHLAAAALMTEISLLAAVVGLLWRAFDFSFPLNFVVYIFLWPVLELLFYLRIRRFRRLRTAQPLRHHPTDTASVLNDFWPRVLAEDPIEDIIEGWFVGDGELRVGNIEELVGWTLYARPAPSLSVEQRAVRDDIVAQCLAKMQTQFAPGYNATRVCLLHTLEPLAICYKPLIFYMVVQAVRDIAWRVLAWRGFELRSHGGCRYWYHPGSSGGEGATDAARATAAPPAVTPPAPAAPLVVLHGVGGLVPYVPLLLRLRADRPRAPIVAPLLPHCSIFTPPFEPPPPLDTSRLVAGLAEALRSLARNAPGASEAAPPTPCHFFGHSLGTAIQASMVREHPSLVASATFVDPICFLIYRHHVVYNFLYREPKPLRHGPFSQGKHFGYWFRLALHYMLKQEPTIQSCFRREFWWGRHWLHPHMLPCAAHVVLSGRDAIVPSHQVHAYLVEQSRRPRAAREQVAVGPRRVTPPLGIELHERWHHGLAILLPFAMRKVLSPFYRLVDDNEPPLALHGREREGDEPAAEEAHPARPVGKVALHDQALAPYPVSYKVAIADDMRRGQRISREAVGVL